MHSGPCACCPLPASTPHSRHRLLHPLGFGLPATICPPRAIALLFLPPSATRTTYSCSRAPSCGLNHALLFSLSRCPHSPIIPMALLPHPYHRRHPYNLAIPVVPSPHPYRHCSHPHDPAIPNHGRTISWPHRYYLVPAPSLLCTIHSRTSIYVHWIYHLWGSLLIFL